MTATPPPLWNTAQCAEYLGVSRATVRSLVKQDRIPWVRVGERGIRFQPDDLAVWVASRQHQAVR
jgi:excisionase family DNA binding protein